MSRIGNRPITIPAGVDLAIQKDFVGVKGPKGEQQVPLFDGIRVSVKENQAIVERSSDLKSIKAKHGLVQALLTNSIIGSHEGFSKTLLLQGVGYRANKKGSQVVLSLGFSHDIPFDEPEDVKIEVQEQTRLIVSGIDKQRVGQIAAQIRSFRPPEPYKGKGIRYEGEIVRKKAGKAGKK